MMISKITVIVMVVVILAIMTLGAQRAFADNDHSTSPFKINVVLNGADSETGVIKVFISSEDDAYQERILNPFKDGRAGVVDLKDFVFEANSIPSGDTFEACVQSVAHPQNKECVQGINHKGKHIETVIVPVPIGIGRPPLDKGQYDDTNTFYPNGNFPNSNNNEVLGDDSTVYDQDYTGGTPATMHLLISP